MAVVPTVKVQGLGFAILRTADNSHLKPEVMRVAVVPTIEVQGLGFAILRTADNSHLKPEVMRVAVVPAQMTDACRPTRRATSAWV